jgi:hypothetical protein
MQKFDESIATPTSTYDAAKVLRELDTLMELEAQVKEMEAAKREELAATRIDPEDQRFWCWVILLVFIPCVAWFGVAFVSYQRMNPFKRKKVEVDASGLGKRAARRKANATGILRNSDRRSKHHSINLSCFLFLPLYNDSTTNFSTF